MRMKANQVLAAIILAIACGAAIRIAAAQSGPAMQAGTVRVDTNPAHILNSFEPDKAIGSSMDVLSHDVIDEIYTPAIMKEMLSAGYGTISYRNNSELRALAWHWNPNGAWSDPAHQSGYYTSSTEVKDPIRYILSYNLPHRGTGRAGDSPLIDGDVATYWKSNPYLTSKFTGESDTLHRQWVIIDLKKPTPINALRIGWANPYAVNYEVDYWTPAENASGEQQDPLSRNPSGQWPMFPAGVVKNSRSGTATVKLSDLPITARYLRIWMTQSSNTCDTHGADDPRNCVGYAIDELYAGTIDGGAFTDVLQHAAVASPAGRGRGNGNGVANGVGESQPSTTVSSVDPWHSVDGEIGNGRSEHTGFDLFFTSGITRGLPAMIPVTMLYGTPDDAAAEIAYVEKRGYPISYIEMGEEPDGQKIRPEDYAALYVQWAAAIHKVDPKLKLGGPVFEGINEDINLWPDPQGRTSWSRRFFDYMRAHGRLADVTFWSTEHYPLEPCEIQWTDLYKEPAMMTHVIDSFRENGVPANVPIMVTESSLSWRLTGPMSQIYGGLWLADNVGSFFAAGGAEFHHSPIQPERVSNTCEGAATWSNFVPDAQLNVKSYTAFYFAARLINLEWVKHGAGVHQMFPASVDIKDEAGNSLVTSYALKRPDGDWSLLLVNRDQSNPHAIKVTFDNSAVSTSRPGSFKGPVTMITFGSEQYVWQEAGADSHADPDGPPVTTQISAGRDTTFTLPKASITVLRGKLAE
jgi:F5/8 type C domain-containing protein